MLLLTPLWLMVVGVVSKPQPPQFKAECISEFSPDLHIILDPPFWNSFYSNSTIVLCLKSNVSDAPKIYSWTPKNPINLWELSGRFEGDLVSRPSHKPLSRSKRCFMTEGVDYWPNGVVPLDIKYDEFDWKEMKTIKKAFHIIETKTCLRFPARLENDTFYVELRGSLGHGECWSYLGRQDGNQTLSLGDGEHYMVGHGSNSFNWFLYGSIPYDHLQIGFGLTNEKTRCVNLHHVLHEILHALGMVHQHSAPDRDDYINIHWENIEPDFIQWFDKYDWSEYTDFGLGYDYYSVMHYSAYIASKNGEPTISAKDETVKIEERTTLSEKDVKKLNIMYCEGRGRWRGYRTFGGYIVDLVDEFSPVMKHVIALCAAITLLLLTSVVGRLVFVGLLRMRSVPEKTTEKEQVQADIEKKGTQHINNT